MRDTEAAGEGWQRQKINNMGGGRGEREREQTCRNTFFFFFSYSLFTLLN